jgi:hypothetical protein
VFHIVDYIDSSFQIIHELLVLLRSLFDSGNRSNALPAWFMNMLCRSSDISVPVHVMPVWLMILIMKL